MTKVRIAAGIAVFVAVAVSWMCAVTLYNRLRIYFKRDQYRVEELVVTDVVYRGMRRSSRLPWLTGTIDGLTEQVRPEPPPGFDRSAAEDLLAAFPRGTRLPVLYDPNAPEMLIQGESLRVRHFTPEFWQKEARLRIFFLCLFLLPVPLTVAFYRYVRVRDYVIPRFHWRGKDNSLK